MYIIKNLLPNAIATPLCRYIGYCMAYGWCFVSSVLFVHKRRPKMDYSKYLGPEWKPSYDKPSTVICNHSTWLDTPVMMTINSPSFIAKASVRKIPFVGYMAD